MELFSIENLNFKYKSSEKKALKDVSFRINTGEIITLCGVSGCGKSTLLRHFKSVLMPDGERSGNVIFKGKSLAEWDMGEQTCKIGFISQSADNQIVTDKVYHELAFGLESLGMDNQTIRLRVAEMSTFFGIDEWFYKDVNKLSGGQKQILALASVMTMMPEIIIADEPTSQLDIIAAREFTDLLVRINKELGVTVLITEHRLENILPHSNRVIVMDDGKIIEDDSPKKVCVALRNRKHKMFKSMPVPAKIWNEYKEIDYPCPLTINEGRMWLEENSDKICINPHKNENELRSERLVLETKEVWFKYEKNAKDTLKGISVKFYAGNIYGILGGNGAGKSTFLSVISGVKKTYRGTVSLREKAVLMPQNPKNLFVKNSVLEELSEITNDKNKINNVIDICRLDFLLNMHPYDLSGGEMQRLALGKILLTDSEILMFDEPTKGMDNDFKEVLGEILSRLVNEGKTIIIVSHDIEFCSKWTNYSYMIFNGELISGNNTRVFFRENNFYTTAANQMARNICKDVIIPEDLFKTGENISSTLKNSKSKISDIEKVNNNYGKINSVKKIKEKSDNKSLRYKIMAFMCLIAIPFTIYTGINFFDNRKYLFISLLIMLEAITPFFLMFEGGNPGVKRVVIISVLCGICVAVRLAFYMIPQFKPMMAIVIISGVVMGAETGFLIGALSILVSNMFFGQGPWTPWQMFAMGLSGLLAGIFFYGIIKDKSKNNKVKKIIICLYGMIAAVVIYGGIVNPASMIMSHMEFNLETLLSFYAAGLPMDLIQGICTVIFLWLLLDIFNEKLSRVL